MMHVTKQFQHIKIQLDAIISATNNFSDDNCIGHGGFGKVYKGVLIHNSKGQTMVAIKRLNRAFGQGDPEFWKEIIMLSRYKHENIVSLLGFCDENDEKILVYEYASKKSLDYYLNSNDLTWIQRLKICIGAARGLAYLHNPGGTQQRVLHRDIKSSNILLDESWNARISDLGLSKFGPANQQITFLVSNAVGTIGYCDPVYVETGVLTKESDVYSFGVMLFEVLCGRLCIGNNNDKHRPLTGLARQCYEQNKVNEIIYQNIKDEIKPKSLKAFTAIAYQCLKRDLEERPLMTKVVRRLELALEHQRGDANDDDSDDEDIIESDLSTSDGGTSRNYVTEKRSTTNTRLKKLREKVIKQQEELEKKNNQHHHTTDFTDHQYLPSDDMAELEWLSNFVHDSFSNVPANNLARTVNHPPENTYISPRLEKNLVKQLEPEPEAASINATTMLLEMERRKTEIESSKLKVKVVEAMKMSKEDLDPEAATIVTGMLLEMDRMEVFRLLESPEALKDKVAEAMEVLRNQQAAKLGAISLNNHIVS